jgi:hypothetical protein
MNGYTYLHDLPDWALEVSAGVETHVRFEIHPGVQ